MLSHIRVDGPIIPNLNNLETAQERRRSWICWLLLYMKIPTLIGRASFGIKTH